MMTNKPSPETVLQEFPPVGKCRVRLIGQKDGSQALDIREYLSAKTFEGFTRRGVRLDARQVAILLDTLKDVAAKMSAPLKKKEEKP